VAFDFLYLQFSDELVKVQPSFYLHLLGKPFLVVEQWNRINEQPTVVLFCQAFSQKVKVVPSPFIPYETMYYRKLLELWGERFIQYSSASPRNNIIPTQTYQKSIRITM
jgi:hypothetical protein